MKVWIGTEHGWEWWSVQSVAATAEVAMAEMDRKYPSAEGVLLEVWEHDGEDDRWMRRTTVATLYVHPYTVRQSDCDDCLGTGQWQFGDTAQVRHLASVMPCPKGCVSNG